MAAGTMQQSKTFYWSGIDDTGDRVKKKKIVALDQGAAVAALQRSGCIPTKVKESAGIDLNMQIGGSVKLKWAARAEFARRLYQLHRAGVGLSAALMSMAEGAKPAVADMYRDLAARTGAGEKLSGAMLEYPRAFDEVTVSYVAAGERTGGFESSLAKLSVLLAKRAAIAAKVKGVMAYPVMVGGTIVLLVVGIVMFLVPAYARIYDSFNATLPTPTLALIVLSKNMLPVFGWDTALYGEGYTTVNLPFFTDWAPLAVAGARIPLINIGVNPVALFAVAFFVFLAWRAFRKRTADNENVNIFLNKLWFRIPVLGKLNRLSAMHRWASTLAGAIETGVPQADAVQLAARASGSKWYQALAPEFSTGLQAGTPLSVLMARHPDLFPPNIRTMVATGEDTGDVEGMLESVTATLTEEVDTEVAGMSAKIEVALLVVMGVIVGGLLVVLYWPILQLATTASQGFSGK